MCSNVSWIELIQFNLTNLWSQILLFCIDKHPRKFPIQIEPSRTFPIGTVLAAVHLSLADEFVFFNMKFQSNQSAFWAFFSWACNMFQTVPPLIVCTNSICRVNQKDSSLQFCFLFLCWARIRFKQNLDVSPFSQMLSWGGIFFFNFDVLGWSVDVASNQLENINNGIIRFVPHNHPLSTASQICFVELFFFPFLAIGIDTPHCSTVLNWSATVTHGTPSRHGFRSMICLQNKLTDDIHNSSTAV